MSSCYYNYNCSHYSHFESITKLFKYAELCAVSVSLLWFSIHLPLAIKISTHYLHLLANIVTSPLFVFMLSNIIVASLVIKCRKFSGAKTELYEELVKGSQSCTQFEADTEEVIFQDKKVILEGDISTQDSDMQNWTVCERTPFEKLSVKEEESSGDDEVCVKEQGVVEDEMSNDEFQRTVEEFIAKQLMFRRQESMATVLQNQGCEVKQEIIN